MKIRLRALWLRYNRSINWKLLIFLLVFLNVKLIIKLFALVFIYLLQPNIKFGFRLKNSRLPLFYPAVILIATCNGIFFKGLPGIDQTMVLITGISFWMACILAMHQVKLFIEKTDIKIVSNTIIVFFIINAVFSYGEIARIIFETGSFNPYRYQGNFQKYFIGTGDYIKGISMDTSVTNAAINAAGVLFFLFQKNVRMTLLCMSVLLITGSNLTNIITLILFFYLFIFRSDRDQKSLIMICSFMLIIFLVKISPQNNQYISKFYSKLSGEEKSANQKPVNLALRETSKDLQPANERKRKIAIAYLDSMHKKNELLNETAVSINVNQPHSGTRPVIPEPNIHTAPYQSKDDTDSRRLSLLRFINAHKITLVNTESLPGKYIAARQTLNFFSAYPLKFFFGNGMGQFSSKLAFRTTGLSISGGYPAKYTNTNEDFLLNHFTVYASFFSGPAKLHSVVNSPNSAYLQIAGEYGLAGILAFIFWYVGYFLKRQSAKNYGLPMLLLLGGFLFTDYWFEQLSIITLFELFLLLNEKENLIINE